MFHPHTPYALSLPLIRSRREELCICAMHTQSQLHDWLLLICGCSIHPIEWVWACVRSVVCASVCMCGQRALCRSQFSNECSRSVAARSKPVSVSKWPCKHSDVHFDMSCFYAIWLRFQISFCFQCKFKLNATNRWLILKFHRIRIWTTFYWVFVSWFISSKWRK